MTEKPPTQSAREIALETRDRLEGRLYSPSAARNRDVLRDVFVRMMQATGTIIEVGSGTGEHVVHFAAALTGASFHPGDPDAASRASIAAWTRHLGLSNIAPPHDRDVSLADWDLTLPRADALVSINMIHIAPFAAAEGLFKGAGRLLGAKGRLFLYGPFSRQGAHTAPSNAAFDASLKSRDPRWGVRDLDLEIVPLAERAGLRLIHCEAMPANNFSVVFEKVGG